MNSNQHLHHNLSRHLNALQPHQQIDEILHKIPHQADALPLEKRKMQISEANFEDHHFDYDNFNQSSSSEIGQKLEEEKPELMGIEGYLPPHLEFLMNFTTSNATSEFIINQQDDTEMTIDGLPDWQGCVIAYIPEEKKKSICCLVQEPPQEFPLQIEESRMLFLRNDPLPLECLMGAFRKIQEEPLTVGQFMKNAPQPSSLAPNEQALDQFSENTVEINEESKKEEEKVEFSQYSRIDGEEDVEEQGPSEEKLVQVCKEFNFYKHRYALRSTIRLSDKILKELLKAQRLIDQRKILNNRQQHYLNILQKMPHRAHEARILTSADAWRASLQRMKSEVKFETLKTFLTEQFARDFSIFHKFLIACRQNPPEVRNRRDESKKDSQRHYRDLNKNKEIQMINKLKDIVDNLYGKEPATAATSINSSLEDL